MENSSLSNLSNLFEPPTLLMLDNHQRGGIFDTRNLSTATHQKIVAVRQKRQIKLKFYYKCSQVKFGQYVKVVGNIGQLGSWKYEDGIKMKTDQIMYPVWRCHIVIPTIGTSTQDPSLFLLEYKYFLAERSPIDNRETLLRWEHLETPTLNRRLYLNLRSLETLKVLDEDGHCQHLEVQEKDASEDGGFIVDDLTNICFTHSLRQYERMIIMKQEQNIEYGESRLNAGGIIAGGGLHSEDSFFGNVFQAKNTTIGQILGVSSIIEDNKVPDKKSTKQTSFQTSQNFDQEEVKVMKSRLKNFPIEEDPGYSSDSELTHKLDDEDLSPPMIDHYRKSSDSHRAARSISSNPQYSRDEEQEMEEKERFRITNDDRLIVASFKLPIDISMDSKSGQWIVSEGPSLLYPTLYRFRDKKLVKLAWVGWSGHFLEDLTEEEAAELRQLYLEHDCYPIFVSKDEMRKYQHYIQIILYPIFHSLKGLSDQNDDLSYNDYWNTYQQINALVAQEIINIQQSPKDLIWVNDLHLILVPYFIRAQNSDAIIGFFLHSAFPNSQIIQILPQRAELLKSMLSSDLIGFHLFEYAKNFVTSCKKLLDLNYEFRIGGSLGIDVDGRRYVSLRIGHVGIEKECINEVITSQDFTRCFHPLFAKESPVQGKILIAGVDYWHPMSGITNKFRAFYEFLKDNPCRAQEVIFVQYIVPMKASDSVLLDTGLFKKMKDEILDLASQINADFKRQIMKVSFDGATKAQRCALWARADLLLITCMRDGLCLQPLEFLAVKQFLGRLHDASIILSEFAGVSQALPGIHKVNPQNILEVKQKLEHVFSMSCKEKTDMLEQAATYLDRHSTLKWAHSFLKDLKRAHEPTNLSYFMGATYNLNKRILIRGNQDFKYIDTQVVEEIQISYSQSQNRLIIIDHEGTLPRKIHGDPEPSTYALKVLDNLTRGDKKNTVFVLSSHSKREVHQWFSSECVNVGLASEDGYHYRFNSHFKSEYEWQRLLEISPDQTAEWIDLVEALMSHYVDKTDGSCIERKERSIVFDWSEADSQFANMITRELSKQIDALIANGYPIQKVFGQYYLEVKPKELKKSLLLERIMQAITQRIKVDFLLYIGEDSSNEEAFSCLNHIQKTPLKTMLEPANLYTCTVGKKPSNAKYFLKDSHEMCNLLRVLYQTSHVQHQQILMKQMKRKRHKSETCVTLSQQQEEDSPIVEQQSPTIGGYQFPPRSSSAPNMRGGMEQFLEYSYLTSTSNNIEIYARKKGIKN